MIESTKKGMSSSYRIVEFDDKGHDAEPRNLCWWKEQKKSPIAIYFTWFHARYFMITGLGNNSEGTINNFMW